MGSKGISARQNAALDMKIKIRFNLAHIWFMFTRPLFSNNQNIQGECSSCIVFDILYEIYFQQGAEFALPNEIKDNVDIDLTKNTWFNQSKLTELRLAWMYTKKSSIETELYDHKRGNLLSVYRLVAWIPGYRIGYWWHMQEYR